LHCTAGPYTWVRFGRTQVEHIWSDIPSIADIARTSRNFRDVPEADIGAHCPFHGLSGALAPCQKAVSARRKIPAPHTNVHVAAMATGAALGSNGVPAALH